MGAALGVSWLGRGQGALSLGVSNFRVVVMLFGG